MLTGADAKLWRVDLFVFGGMHVMKVSWQVQKGCRFAEGGHSQDAGSRAVVSGIALSQDG